MIEEELVKKKRGVEDLTMDELRQQAILYQELLDKQQQVPSSAIWVIK